MGRRRQRKVLNVYIGSTLTGTYERTPDGSTEFRYHDTWLSSEKAFPISLSMPLSDRIWSGSQISGFFDGLLPDNQAIKDKIASQERAESASTFDLLATIGRDCVGALRFIPEGHDPGNPADMNYRQLSDYEIANRIATLGTSPLGLHTQNDDFRISLAGVQDKTAFLNVNDQWQLPLGATPTSHIFKPSMKEGPDGADFSDTPWNEYICLEFCRAFGLKAAKSEVQLFDNKPVNIVERFDRTWKDNILYRLPQEDMCQALGIPPSKKYQSDGGPGINDILGLLNSANAPSADRLNFLKTQIVFWLLAAIDGHAKNFSIFLTSRGFSLTPIYDVISAAPYPELPEQKIKLAMSIGKNKHFRIKEIQLRHFFQTAQKSGIHKQDVEEILDSLSKKIHPAIEQVNTLAKNIGAPQKTLQSILAGVDKRAGLFSTPSG